ncbi:hypothetical protein EC991_002782 [Linnemannia zychae]|nr:hypothetical protein EC991_002782 [Linnemannia zychae]
MASNASRAGPGGVSGLASSLRSAAGRTGSSAGAGSGPASPGATNNNSNNNQGYYNDNNNSSTNNSQWGGQYNNNNRDRDATVPDSDDSTEEDEEYTSYIQEQEAAAQNNNNAVGGATTKVHNMRNMLHDDQDQEDQLDEQQQRADRQEVQARQNQILEDDDESFEESEDDLEDDDDDASDVNSLTEDDIDFNLVYAFHTFVATQEGQASVVRNDSLMLLEDANVYWWLVRVLKTGVIGYIPAENIETPFERLARLNKYRNVGLSAPSPEWGTFDDPIQPLNPEAAAHKASHRRSVIFTGQNEYFGASENEWDDEDGEGDEDDEMGEYYEGRDEGEEGDNNAESGNGGKSDIQLEAERVQQEILEEEKQRQQQQQQQQQRSRKNSYGTDDSDQDMEGDDEEEEEVTNRYRRPLLDDDDLMFSDEPRKISLTPSIAQDDVSNSRTHTPPGRSKKLRLGEDDDSLNGSPRSTASSPGQRGNEVSASPLAPRQLTPAGTDSASSDYRSGSLESEEEDRAAMQRRMQERTEAKLAALLGDKDHSLNGGSSGGSGDSSESTKKPGKFKSLFGVGKGSKDKEKEKKEKERQERERLAGQGNKAVSSPGGSSFASSADGQRTRNNSSGSIGSAGNASAGPNANNGPMSPTSVSDDGETEIITLRVYPGNVDFGASMYKTVVVNASTQASEVANQAVVKFRLAPDGVASSSDFFLTVRGVDGDETVLLPTDKPMAIYQSLTAHLTTPLPANHRLSISSVSSMMSVNSASSFNSNPPSTPTSPNSVRRIGSGKSDPHQRSIRFLLNKKIKRAGSISSTPGTPTTPTTPTTPMQEDFFWVKVICRAQELPQSMVVIDGMRTAMDKNDPRAQGQVFANKVEHWIPMHSASKAGDVIFKTLETIGIRSGVVEGAPSHVLTSKRNSAPNGIVVEYQLSLKLNVPASPRARQGDELPLVPQTPLVRCFDDHQLAPVRRSPKADVASMPINPEYVFYLKKSPKSVQEEANFTQQQQSQQPQQQPTRKVPAPLQAQSLFGAASNDTPRSPTQPSPSVTSPRSLRSLRSFDDAAAQGSGNGNNGPLSPGLHQTRLASPLQGSAPINGARTGSPSLGPEGNARIPRRTDSVILTPTSPIRATHAENAHSGRPSPTPGAQQVGGGSRTPTPDHSGMGRNRSPSVSQGMRPGQGNSSPIPGGAENDISRSSTPERPARPERPDRPQRAIAQPLTHGPSPLSLTAVMLQANEQSNDPTLIAPLNIKKNEAQGMDVYLDKGVVRSSRLMNSKQYRYSFIPAETGEEVDISDIIEDILGEETADNEQQPVVAAREDVLQHLTVANTNDAESVTRRERTAAAVARAANAAASRKERLAASQNQSEVVSSATRTRVGSPIAMRMSTDEQQHQLSREGSPSPTQSRQAQNHNRALASPLSLSSTNSPPTSLRNKKRESDVEIQVASVASLSTRSASPMLTEQPPSARGIGGSDSATPGSLRSLRAGSPYGIAKPTLISNANAVLGNNRANTSGATSSPLRDSNEVSVVQDSARSFSPIPRRLQSPSQGGNTGSTPSSTSSSPNLRPSSPSSIPNGGRISPAAAAGVQGRSNSGASISSISSVRNRSASTSHAESKPTSLSHSNSNSSNRSHSERSITPGGKEWLLSSDYNAGMQDLLTLVRAGRSSSVSSPSNSSMHLLRGAAGGGNPWIGKDGKLVALPSAIKASLLNNNRSQSPSSESDNSTALRGKGSSSSLNSRNNNSSSKNNHSTSNDINDKSGTGVEDVIKNEEQARMMLLMLNELTLKDVQQDCHPDVYDCWKDVDADLDRVERELDDLLVTVKASIF